MQWIHFIADRVYPIDPCSLNSISRHQLFSSSRHEAVSYKSVLKHLINGPRTRTSGDCETDRIRMQIRASLDHPRLPTPSAGSRSATWAVRDRPPPRPIRVTTLIRGKRKSSSLYSSHVWIVRCIHLWRWNSYTRMWAFIVHSLLRRIYTMYNNRTISHGLSEVMAQSVRASAPGLCRAVERDGYRFEPGFNL